MLPKIDELIRHIAKLSNAAVIKISESKLNYSMLTSKIQINEYDLLCCDRNGHGDRVVCYIGNNLSHNIKFYFPKDKEKIFFEILPSSKPTVAGTIYHPPN